MTRHRPETEIPLTGRLEPARLDDDDGVLDG